MYMLDGDIVEAGNAVHHLEYGNGIVRELWTGGMAVEFAAGRAPVLVEANGFISGRKVIFWSPPLMLVPRKADRPTTLDRVANVLQSVLDLTRRAQ